MDKDKQSLGQSKTIEQKTDPERQVGGPQSGFPAPFVVGQELAPFLIAGVDFGANYCLVASYVKELAFEVTREKLSSRFCFNTNGSIRVVEVDAQTRTLPVKMYIGQNVRFQHGKHSCSPETVLHELFSELKRRVERTSDRLLAKAVVTVPAGFTHKQRKSLIDTAEEAGVKIFGLVNEPTAVALATVVERGMRSGKILVISAGATTFEVSTIDLQDGLLEIKATKGNRQLAGYELTDLFAKHIAEHCSTSHLDTHGLLTFAERTKRMAGQGDAIAMMEGWAEPVVLNKVCKQLIESYGQGVGELIEEVLSDSFMEAKNITSIILHGGTTQFPAVKLAVKAKFPKAPVIETGPMAAAFGASMFAALQIRQLKGWVVWDVVSNPTIFAQGSKVKQAIAVNSPTPINGYAEFESGDDATVHATILQKRTDNLNEIVEVARLEVKNVSPSPAGTIAVDLAVQCSADGVLTFSARHKQLDVNLPLTLLPPEQGAPIIVQAPVFDKNAHKTGIEPTISRDQDAQREVERLFGVGMEIRLISNNKWIVDRVEEESPASTANIRLFDEVLTVDASSTHMQERLLGLQGTWVHVKLCRGDFEYKVKLKREFSSGTWKKEQLRQLLADAVLAGRDRRLIALLLELAALSCMRTTPPDFDEAELIFNRAFKLASTLLEKHDPLYVMAAADLCWFEINNALRLMEQPENIVEVDRASARATNLCNSLIAEVEDNRELHGAPSGKYLSELANTLIPMKRVHDFRPQIERLLELAISIADRAKTPAEVIEDYRSRLSAFRGRS